MAYFPGKLSHANNQIPMERRKQSQIRLAYFTSGGAALPIGLYSLCLSRSRATL